MHISNTLEWALIKLLMLQTLWVNMTVKMVKQSQSVGETTKSHQVLQMLGRKTVSMAEDSQCPTINQRKDSQSVSQG